MLTTRTPAEILAEMDRLRQTRTDAAMAQIRRHRAEMDAIDARYCERLRELKRELARQTVGAVAS